MKLTPVNSPNVPKPSGGYSQGTLVEGAEKILFVSGQIPESCGGLPPEIFEEQARLVWRNIEYQLLEAGMALENIVKHTTYLSSRDYRTANSEIRREVLANLKPALTVIIADIYDPAWLLEIEVIAVA